MCMASWKHNPYKQGSSVILFVCVYKRKPVSMLCHGVNLQIQKSGLMGHSSLTTPLTGQRRPWYSAMWYRYQFQCVFTLKIFWGSCFMQYHKMLSRHENMKIWSHGARSQLLMQLKPRSHSLVAWLTGKDVFHLTDPLWQAEVQEGFTGNEATVCSPDFQAVGTISQHWAQRALSWEVLEMTDAAAKGLRVCSNAQSSACFFQMPSTQWGGQDSFAPKRRRD